MESLRFFSNHSLSPENPIWISSSIFYKFRRLWKFNNLASHLVNPDNTIFNLIGGTLYLFAGNNAKIQNIARGARILSGMFDIFEQETILLQTWERWKKSVQVRAINPHSHLKNKTYKDAFASVQSYENLKKTAIKALRVIKSTFDLGKELFILCMRIMDVFDLIFMDKHQAREIAGEGILEFPFHIWRCIYEYDRNKKHICNLLTQQKGNLEIGFKILGCDPKNAAFVLGEAKNFLEFIQPHVEAGLRIGANAHKWLGDIFKSRVYGINEEGWFNFTKDYRRQFDIANPITIDTIERLRPNMSLLKKKIIPISQQAAISREIQYKISLPHSPIKAM